MWALADCAVPACLHQLLSPRRCPGAVEDYSARWMSDSPSSRQLRLRVKLATSPLAGTILRTDADDGRGADTSTQPILPESAGRKRSAGASCISRTRPMQSGQSIHAAVAAPAFAKRRETKTLKLFFFEVTSKARRLDQVEVRGRRYATLVSAAKGDATMYFVGNCG